jgi:hypothetical protein
MKCISYISKEYLHWKHQLPNSPATTGGGYDPLFTSFNLKEATTPLIIWLQPEGGYNPLILSLQPEGSSNSLCSPAPTRRRIKIPFLSLYFHPKIQV